MTRHENVSKSTSTMVFSPSLPLPWWIILFSMYTPPTPDPNDTLYWKFKANGPKFPKEKLAETTKRHHPTKLPRGLKIGLLLPKMELISLKLPSKIHICDMWQDCTLQSVIGAANGQTKIQNAFGYWSILPKISRKKLLISLGVSWRLGNVQKFLLFGFSMAPLSSMMKWLAQRIPERRKSYCKMAASHAER